MAKGGECGRVTTCSSRSPGEVGLGGLAESRGVWRGWARAGLSEGRRETGVAGDLKLGGGGWGEERLGTFARTPAGGVWTKGGVPASSKRTLKPCEAEHPLCEGRWSRSKGSQVTFSSHQLPPSLLFILHSRHSNRHMCRIV